MPIPLIRTKLHRPPVAKDHLHRKHLLDRLESRRHRPLTLVSAPAGYGKSTLVSCWLESCGCPSAWVSLDTSDSDLRTFMLYFLEAIESMFSGAVSETRLMLKGTDLPPLDILAASLINELYEIDKHFILVLDDYHTIRDKAVHELINQLLAHPPASMHLAVATRRDPPFPIFGLRARGQMTDIRVQDLRFSPDEVNAFLKRVMGMEVDPPTTAVIEEKTEGWVAGLRLAALSFRDRSDINRILSNLPENNRYVMDYIIAEVLSHQPVEIKDYLLSTAILGRFCAPLCEAMCVSQGEISDCPVSGRQFISMLESENMFLIPLDDGSLWYRYHHLFKQLLQREMKRKFKPERIRALNNKAGKWFEANDLPDEALHYLLAADNIPAARHLIIKHRYDLTRHEKWHRLDQWLHAIPDNHISTDPELLIITGWLHENHERYHEMRKTIEQVERLLSDDAVGAMNTGSLFGELEALKAADYYIGGDVRQTKKHAARAIQRIPAPHLSERAFALLVNAFAHQMDGDAHHARKTIHEALQSNGTTGNTYTARLLLTLCFVDWLEGDLTGVQGNATRLLQLGQAADLLESAAFGHYHLGTVAFYLGDTGKARLHLAAAVRNGRLVDSNTFLHANCALALCYHAGDQPEESEKIARALVEYAMRANHTGLLSLANAFNAELALRRGHLAEAVKWARDFPHDPPKQAVRFFVPQFTRAKILIAQGTPSAYRIASDLLSQLYQFFTSVHNTHCRIEVLTLRALLEEATGDQPTALAHLESALGLAEQSRRKRPFRGSGPPMAALLSQLRSQGRFTGYIDMILSARDRLKTPAPIHSSFPPLPGRPIPSTDGYQPLDEPLTNRELDVVTLLADRLSNKEIAEKLFIAPGTVKRHTNNIYRKLATHNRQEAVAKAKTIGLL